MIKPNFGDALKGIKKLSIKEKRIMRETIQKQKGELPVQKVDSLSDSELIQMKIDCADTLKVLDRNKPNYMLAEFACQTLKKQVQDELDKRNLK